MPMVDGELVWVADGVPELRVAIVPRDEVRFTDGWHVQGLKGTGSYDYEVADVFVPEHRTFALFTREPQRGSSPTFRMGLMPIIAAGHAGWALGVAAQHARRRPRARRHQGAHGRPVDPRQQAQLPAGPGPPRVACGGPPACSSLDTFGDVEAAVGAGEDAHPDDARRPARRRGLRHRLLPGDRRVGPPRAGTTAIREGSRLERAFRDLYTGTQHAFISEKVAIDAAQVWLGLVDDPLGL